MDEDPQGPAWRKVTPVGDAWILCKSKSHRGHIYYFNTLTGETAWNLSDAEVEKARKYTKKLEGQPGVKPKCPEPKDQPPPQLNSPPPSKILSSPNKAIQKSPQKPTHIPRKHKIHPFVQEDVNHASLSGVFQNGQFCNVMNQMNNLSGIETIQNINALNVNNSMMCAPLNSIYNPTVWAVPHTQQVLVTPTVGPGLINQAQTSINVAYNHIPMNLSQNGPQAMCKPMNNYNNERQYTIEESQQRSRKIFTRHTKFNTERHNKYVKPYMAQNKDLRRRIGDRRCNSTSSSKSGDNGHTNDQKQNTEEMEPHHYYDDFIMNHRYAQTHEESSKLDLIRLKSLAAPDTSLDIWFIVVDLNVLLTEFKFLNNLTDSDENCHLLVPQLVMSQLQEYVSSCKDMLARRILRFLSQQIEIGHAFMAEDPSCLESNDNTEVILKTGIDYANKKYFLVLISNDEEILNYKDSSNINIFSVIEIKTLLNCPLSSPVSTMPKQTPFSLEKIKIVIQNKKDENSSTAELINGNEANKDYTLHDMKTDDIEQHSSVEMQQKNVEKTIECHEKNNKEVQWDQNVFQEISKPLENIVHENDNTLLKRTVDAGIQTDFQCLVVSVNNDKECDATEKRNVKAVSMQPESSNTLLVPSNMNSSLKKREIKLIRSLSNQNTVTGTNIVKKNFKWRRRRNSTHVPNQLTNDTDATNTQNYKIISPTRVPTNEPRLQVTSKCVDNIINMDNPKVSVDQNTEKGCISLGGSTRTTTVLKKDTNNEVEKITSVFEANDRSERTTLPTLIRSKNISTDKFTFTNHAITKSSNNNVAVQRNVTPIVKSSEGNAALRISNTNESIVSSESSITFLNRNNSGNNNNITIEETSTSGIISNSESNIDERDYSYGRRQESINDSDLEQNMYQIDNDGMGEYLAVKCDEWVSRYMQIMEEVLTLVLQQDPPFSHKSLPPPWTLHEAAQCIKIKFNNLADIRNAANNLSLILFNVSDANGKISMDMSPYQYMKMYSAGVYLLAGLKGVSNNPEDIQTAVELLKLLLDDIRNPNLDSSTTDVLNESMPDVVVDSQVSKTYLKIPEKKLITNEKEKQRGTYHLRSNKKKEIENKNTPAVKFIRNLDVKSSFLENLKLQSVSFTDVSADNNNTQDNQNLESDTKADDVENKTATAPPANEPKIVRNFTFCADIEKKLQNKLIVKTYEEHDLDLDYEEDYGEYLNDEYEADEHIHENDDVINEEYDYYDDEQFNETECQKTVDPTNTNEKFRYLMDILLREISAALHEVQRICDLCYVGLKRPNLSEVQKLDLRKLIEKAHFYLGNVSQSLDSMIDQETINTKKSIRDLLENADINIGQIDDKLLSEYRTTLAECKEHATVFLNTVQSIMAAFTSKVL